jgi:hypothetical protein
MRPSCKKIMLAIIVQSASLAALERSMQNARVRRWIRHARYGTGTAHFAEARRLSTAARNAFFIWGPQEAYTTGRRLASVSLLRERVF